MIKKEKMHFIKHARLLMTDFMEIKFVNGLTMINLYVPPADSAYYDEQYVQLLASEFCEADENEYPMLSMGDTNTRLGELNESMKLTTTTTILIRK